MSRLATGGRPSDMDDVPTGASPEHGTTSRSPLSRWLRHLVWIPVIVLVLWTVIPLVMSLSMSLKTRAMALADRGIIPRDPTLQAYVDVMSRDGFWTSVTNSVILGFTTIALTLLLAVPAAYSFARLGFRGRTGLLLFSLIPLLIPKVALMLPLYQMGVTFNGLDTRWFLTIVFTGTLLPLATFLMVGAFQAIPRELEEAAAVDGATFFQRLRRVILPLSIPAIITVGVLSFREAWTEFDLVLALTTTAESRTIPYELFLAQEFAGLPNLPGEAAFAILTVLPLLLVYSYVERYITGGALSGSDK